MLVTLPDLSAPGRGSDRFGRIVVADSLDLASRLARVCDVDEDGPAVPQAQESSGAAVRDKAALAADENGGEEAAVPLVAGMADRVDAAEDRVQVAGGDSSGDDPVSGAQGSQLST